ncbi:putative efflux protein, MATE family [Clostridium cavendishii DSM 21758]|uniref:Multidrug export protein MepA n=1 Tax=Clostridium cavendishii DSM 21758 TaxID=1121302 RepID=A0A1M6RB97_9CLOT|nr:MATE family efflux transporter [Clostridium cavendishii]SHK29706.1 putative efflux protein, MATE family [Clostridium cavendishii DSM 21758]
MQNEQETKALRRKFFKYTLPSISAMWVYSLYTIIDGIFVGRGVGPNALAAVNLAMPFVNFIFACSVLFSTGASTIISIYLGKKNLKSANEVFTLNIVSMIIFSIAILILSLLNLERLAIFLGATDSTLPMVKEFLRIIISFNTFFVISYYLEVIVKTDGFPYFSIIGVCLSAITNIFLDYIFVIKLNFGVAGAAYATGISQVIACVFFLVHFLKKNSTLKFVKFKYDFNILKRIISIGLPDFITEMSTGVVLFIFNQVILNRLGENGIITFGIISYVNTLVLMTMIGITQGMQPLSSYYYGKGDSDTISKLFNMSLKTVAFVSIFIFSTVLIFSSSIVNVFIKNADVDLFNYSVYAFKLFSTSFLVVGYNILISGFFASIEKPTKAIAISLSRGLVTIILSLFIMTTLFNDLGIWIATLVSEILCILISITVLKRNPIT